MPRHRLLVLVALAFVLTACSREQAIDWAAPENFFYHEASSDAKGGVQLTYWALVDAPADAIYRALIDVENYMHFVDGVDRTQLLKASGNTKTIQIAQRVIGRQSNAKVKWTFSPADKHIDFTTLQSDLNFNDGHYELESSPDGKRCLVRSTFLVKAGQGMTQSVPIGVLAAGTREAFLAAARGVKQRASGAR